jgi:AcrR family transcriptional regulator
MQDWVPVPGSARRRLLDAALAIFERDGFEAAGVVDIAATAGVTTGSLYHHFESKLGLFKVIRREMERRVRDRIEGAAAVAGGGRRGVAVALLVGFDAAVRFKAARILSDDPPEVDESTLRTTLTELTAPAPGTTAPVLLGAWRSALAEAARGDAAAARAGLAWALGVDGGTAGPASQT